VPPLGWQSTARSGFLEGGHEEEQILGGEVAGRRGSWEER
jgi:hypothetical protein